MCPHTIPQFHPHDVWIANRENKNGHEDGNGLSTRIGTKLLITGLEVCIKLITGLQGAIINHILTVQVKWIVSSGHTGQISPPFKMHGCVSECKMRQRMVYF